MWWATASAGRAGCWSLPGLTLAALPCNLWAVRVLRRRERGGPCTCSNPARHAAVALRRPAFWGIAACFGLFGLNHGILITYVLELFADRGAGAGMAATAAACIGPSQVVGRLLFMVGEARVGNARATMLALGSVVAAGGASVAGRSCAALDLCLCVGARGGHGADVDPAPFADRRHPGAKRLWRDFGRGGHLADPCQCGRTGAGALMLLTLGGTGLVYASCLAMAVTGLGDRGVAFAGAVGVPG
jgi:hypothetical protein